MTDNGTPLPSHGLNHHLSYQIGYRSAEKCHDSLFKSLSRKPDVKHAYTDIIRQYECDGYIRRIQPDVVGHSWYLPHFPVLKSDRDTTKCRIVYDGASVHQGVALNDVISKGPKLQSELFDILTRFRHNPVAIACDITKMYLQIKIPAGDTPLKKFWG